MENIYYTALHNYDKETREKAIVEEIYQSVYAVKSDIDAKHNEVDKLFANFCEKTAANFYVPF